MGLSLRQADGPLFSYGQSRRREGNRLFITFNPTAPGAYQVMATGSARAGVEHGEEFRQCEAVIEIPHDQPLSVPLTLEAP